MDAPPRRGRPRPPLDEDQADLVDHLAQILRAARALDAAYAADRAEYTQAIRDIAAAIPGWGISGRAVADTLTAQGIPCTEGLIRKWARATPGTPGAPTWWEAIDHRPPDELRSLMERTLGMAVDVGQAPVVRVPATDAQVAALREALPEAVIGPEAEISGG